MFETFANFQKLIELYEGPEDTTEITLEYQKTEDPVLLAVVFCKWFPLALEVSNQFFTLTMADKATHALYELNRAMLAFDPERGNQIQTVYIKFYRNRLNTEARKLAYAKRRADMLPVMLSEIMYQADMVDHFGEAELLQTLEQSKVLTKNELRYCEIVVRYNDKILDTEIACQLGISPSAITQIKQSLVKKFRRMQLISY